MSSRLLPHNSTLLERAVADSSALSDLPVELRKLWDVDQCPPEFLPYLGWTLAVDFWELASSAEQRRELIRGAIAWHRKRGTPWAIKQALAAFGYPVLELVEQRQYQEAWKAAGGRLLDGTWSLTDGGVLDSPNVTGNGQMLRRAALSHWAQYAIRLNATDGEWSREQQRKIRLLAETYAPQRSELVAIIASLQAQFDARIWMRDLVERSRVRLGKCRRFQPAARRTLDGCWTLDGGTAPLPLDGSWSLDGRALNGITLTGVPLDNGHIQTRQRLRLRLRLHAGGARTPAPLTMGEQWRRLDGSWRLDEMTLQDWSLDQGRALGDAQLARIGQPRLDGTWLLGAPQGGPGMWFNGRMRIKKNGITTQEPL
ncbi:phage tail protein I [Pseudomonas guariconensis]|uniref:phage tail protein I n=1 Tax=Pseudomonas guariconensis TaxID=1288410 RepID=UPI0039EA2F86